MLSLISVLISLTNLATSKSITPDDALACTVNGEVGNEPEAAGIFVPTNKFLNEPERAVKSPLALISPEAVTLPVIFVFNLIYL